MQNILLMYNTIYEIIIKYSKFVDISHQIIVLQNIFVHDIFRQDIVNLQMIFQICLNEMLCDWRIIYQQNYHNIISN